MKKALRGFSALVAIFLVVTLNICYAKDICGKKYIRKNISIENKIYESANIKGNNNSFRSKNYGSISKYEELVPILKEAMNNRETDIKIKYTGNEDFNQINQIIEKAVNSDDYLKFSWKGFNAGIEGYDGDLTLTLGFRYLTTKAEEDYVDKKVDSILSTIIKDGMNDYAKEKAIHDYIVSHVKYDTSYIEHSAYAALAKGTTVCQGYSLLMCKMLQKVGIKSIIVESRPMNHAWNMVYIDNKWYHVDATWDDPIPDVQNRILYNYYNLTDDEISDVKRRHVWNRDEYPKAVHHYDPKLTEGKVLNNKKIQASETNSIRFCIKLNQNIKMKKVELFDNNKFIDSTESIKDNYAFMEHKGSLEDKVYKLKITVEDGRVCFTNVKVQSTLKVLKVHDKDKFIEIKSLVNGTLCTNNISRSVKSGEVIKVKLGESVTIKPNTILNGVAYNSVKIN